MGSQKTAIQIPSRSSLPGSSGLGPRTPHHSGPCPAVTQVFLPVCNLPLCKGEVVSVQNTETAVPLPERQNRQGRRATSHQRPLENVPAPAGPRRRQLHRQGLHLGGPADHPEGIQPRPRARGPPALGLLLDLRPDADPGRPPDRQVRSAQGHDGVLRRLGRGNGGIRPGRRLPQHVHRPPGHRRHRSRCDAGRRQAQRHLDAQVGARTRRHHPRRRRAPGCRPGRHPHRRPHRLHRQLAHSRSSSPAPPPC